MESEDLYFIYLELVSKYNLLNVIYKCMIFTQVTLTVKYQNKSIPRVSLEE